MKKLLTPYRTGICPVILLTGLLFFYFLTRLCPAGEPFYHSPTADSRVENRCPNISLSFGGRKINTDSVQVLVNKKDVSDECVILSGFISYRPGSNLPVGKNTVSISFSEQGGKKYNIVWSFNIIEVILIESVEHDYTTPLIEKEDLVVSVKGIKGGKAVFHVGDTIRNIPMTEVKPGFYKGTYKVGQFDMVTDQPVYVCLTSPDGASQETKAKKMVSFLAQLFRLKITSPKNGSGVAQTFIVKGRTRPNSKVLITVSVAFRRFNNMVKAHIPESGGIETNSNEDGYFEKEMGFPMSVVGLRATVTAYARDKKGQKSMADEITVFLEPKKNGENKTDVKTDTNEDKKKK